MLIALNMISWPIQHHSELKRIIRQRRLGMERAGTEGIVFYGVSNEMEVAYITLQGVNVRLVGIVEDDEKFKSHIIFGYELEPVSRINEFKPDCVLITSLEESEKKTERLQAFIDV